MPQLIHGIAVNREYLWSVVLTLAAAAGALGQEPTTFSGYRGRAQHLCFSPDGTLLATTTDAYTLLLWDIRTQKIKVTIQTSAPGSRLSVEAVAFARDGKSVISAQVAHSLADDPPKSQNLVRWWNVQTGQETKRVKLAGGGHSLAFSPDGAVLATRLGGSDPNSDTSVRLWDLTTEKEIAAIKGHGHYVARMAFSSDGNLLATMSPDKMAIWDRKTGKELASWTDFSGTPVFSPDNKLLAVAGSAKDTQLLERAPSALRLWDVATGKELRSMKRQIPNAHDYTWAAFTPDGKTLATGWTGLPNAQLWDVATGELKREMPAYKLTFTPFGKILDDSGRALPKGHVNRLAFSPDGKKLATARTDGGLLLWDVPAGN